MSDPIADAIQNLRKAIANDERCKNVTSIRIFMNTYETRLSKTSATVSHLKQRGISMKNMAGEFIINDYGTSVLPFEVYHIDHDEPEENGSEW